MQAALSTRGGLLGSSCYGWGNSSGGYALLNTSSTEQQQMVAATTELWTADEKDCHGWFQSWPGFKLDEVLRHC